MAFNRDSSLDISLEGGDWVGGASDGTTLWFVNNTFDVAEAYVAATQARDSGEGYRPWYRKLGRRNMRRHDALVRR